MFSAKPACASRSRRAPISRRLSLVFTLFALAAAASPAKAQPPSAPPATRDSYRLAATWKDVPWQPAAGHFQQVLDLDAAPDGTVWVLDWTPDEHNVLHQLSADGVPLRRTGVHRSYAQMLSIGPDGRIHVSEGNGSISIGRVEADGSELSPLKLRSPGGEQLSSVIAVDPSGRIHVARYPTVHPPDCSMVPPGDYPPSYSGTGIDVFDPDGRWLEAYGQEDLAIVDAMDAHPDGRMFVLEHLAPMGPCNQPTSEPTPRPTPRPSLLGAPASESQQTGDGLSLTLASTERPSRIQVDPTDGANAMDGLVAFGSDRRRVQSWPKTPAWAKWTDVAADTKGVVVASSGIPKVIEGFADFKVGATKGPGRYITVTAGGMVVRDIKSEYQSATLWLDPLTGATLPVGESDYPLLAGPPHPTRLSAGSRLQVLQAPFASYPKTMLTKPYVPYDPYGYSAEHSVQRWPLAGHPAAGRPEGQMIQGLHYDQDVLYPTVDVAADGDILYTLRRQTVERMPDPYWPSHTASVGRGAAIAARGGRVAVLDIGWGRVDVRDGNLNRLDTWIYTTELNALPSDVAIDPAGDGGGVRLYLADQGRNRIVVHETGTGETREWPTHDGPVGIDVGPDGDLFVLGRGGWGLRYDPSGLLKAYWRIPDPTLVAGDIAVDSVGNVYVSFLRLGPELSAQDMSRPILDAGIWVFTPTTVSAEGLTLPELGACLVDPDKVAAPKRLPLGQSVEVTLKLSGACPGQSEPVELAIVIDTSFSMSYRPSLPMAQEALQGILQKIDASVAAVSLITFGNGAAVQVPLTDRFDVVQWALIHLVADGDTRMAAGIDLATTELTGPRSVPGRRKVILVVSDGIPKDEPLAAAQRARAEGIDTFGLIVPFEDFGADQESYLHRVVGGPDHYLLNPTAERLGEFARGLTRFRPEKGLLQKVEVTDEIPANMDLVPGSVEPPARQQGRVLSWSLTDIAAADGVTLRYRLQPTEVGTWPTNVVADADYLDATGRSGTVLFPVPKVEVYVPSLVYLPAVARNACNLVGQPFDVVLAIDSSSSMREPMPGGGTRMDAVRAAAMTFATSLDPRQHRVAVIDFNSRATRRSGFSANQAVTLQAIQAIEIRQGTRIDQALLEARQLIDAERRPTARSAVVLLTDGQQGEGASDALALAGQLRTAGTTLFAIGLGDGTDQVFLSGLGGDASHTFPTTDGQNLGAVYMQIVSAITCRWP